MGRGLPRYTRPGTTRLALHPLDGSRRAALVQLRHCAHALGRPRQNMLDLIDHDAFEVELGADEGERAHVIEQGEQRSPESSDIRDHDRLAVTAELRPGDLLDEFLERPDAAR